MFSEHERVDSRAMGRPMHLWRFGHYGVPLLVMPSSAGMAHEWQYNGLIETLRPLIEGCRLNLYCSESNVAETWASDDAEPVTRVTRHQDFETYILEELVPLIRRDCQSATIRIAVAGTSLGAFYAANLVLKHPELFFYGLCMSGRYDATWLTDGFTNDDIYYNNPMAFVPNLDGDELERVRSQTHLDLVCGQGDFEGSNVPATREFARVLADKGISHVHDLWGSDVTHEPKWWSRQAALYLTRRFGDGESTGS
jgi:esterase/lipase superfamily enzyme